MNTSIVIPLAANGFGSRHNDIELRYCLRGIEKHLTGYGDIFLIGNKPRWVKNVIHIPATDEDRTWWKERNIYRKIFLACEDPRVTDEFLFMNDDHFLLADFDAATFPYYYEGCVSDQYNRIDQYGNTVRNTSMEVAPEMWPTEYYDIHCPIRYHKENFEYLGRHDWNKKYGYCIKTLYCYHTRPLDTEYLDLKIRTPLPVSKIKELIKDRLFFSTDNRAMEGGGMEAVLKELYPLPSRYEM